MDLFSGRCALCETAICIVGKLTITLLHKLVELVDSTGCIVMLHAILERVVLILMCLPVCLISELLQVVILELISLGSKGICRGIGEKIANSIVVLKLFRVGRMDELAYSPQGSY